jgi:hypothetical protein
VQRARRSDLEFDVIIVFMALFWALIKNRRSVVDSSFEKVATVPTLGSIGTLSIRIMTYTPRRMVEIEAREIPGSAEIKD